VATMDHAVFASRIARDALYHAIFIPIDLLQHLLVGGIMTVGHQITGRLPTFDVARGDSPSGAGQFAFASEEFLIDRGPKNSKALPPFLNLRELLPCHLAGEEEVLGLFAETFG